MLVVIRERINFNITPYSMVAHIYKRAAHGIFSILAIVYDVHAVLRCVSIRQIASPPRDPAQIWYVHSLKSELYNYTIDCTDS